MRVDRLLSMLLIISKKGLVTGKELAEHFEVSIRTIYRDIDKLCEAGVPIAATGGKGGGYYIMDNYNIDKLFLNKGEIKTLVAVMNSLNFLFGKNQQFNDIILKFENSNQEEKSQFDKFQINMSHFSMENELKEYLSIMNRAIEESKLLHFYYINRNMVYSERIVEPIQIDFVQGQWYLTGFCRMKNDWRKFKLVRIRDLKISIPFQKREVSKEEMEKIFNDGYDQKSIKVKLKFTNKIGEQLTEYFVKENITKTKENDYIVEEFFPDEEGLIKYILSFGKECEVLEPKDLRKKTTAYIRELFDKYNG